MYAHRVIEDVRGWLSEANKTRTAMYKKNHNQIVTIHEIVADLLPISQCFFFGNAVSNILLDTKANGTEPILQMLNGYINLPYNPLWLEFNDEKIKLGVLLTQHKNEDRALLNDYDLFCFAYRNQAWEVVPKVASIHNGVIENITIPSNNSTPGTDDYIICCASLAHIALLLLNCKNVVTEKISAPTALNKKRMRSNKQPLLDYHILKIAIPASRKSNHGASEALYHNRVHLCRGHFKEYTQDNPLFGKFTGLYWWQPHVRGQNKDGIVIKDYEIQ